MVARFSIISGMGPESGRKPVFLSVALSGIFGSRKDPGNDADLIDLRKKQASPSLLQSGGDNLPGSQMERTDDRLIIAEKGIHP
jgi:hypothetical protein